MSYLHARVLVGPDFLAALTDDDGGLRAADDGFRGAARHSEGAFRVDGAEADAEVGLFGRSGGVDQRFVALGADADAGTDEQVLFVLIGTREVGELHESAGV